MIIRPPLANHYPHLNEALPLAQIKTLLLPAALEQLSDSADVDHDASGSAAFLHVPDNRLLTRVNQAEDSHHVL